MIAPSQICCVIEPVDMRRGLDSLSQWIQTSLGTTPCDGTAYAFSNRPKTRLKLLIWDGTGVWCCQRRLHRGAFVWPSNCCVPRSRRIPSQINLERFQQHLADIPKLQSFDFPKPATLKS